MEKERHPTTPQDPTAPCTQEEKEKREWDAGYLASMIRMQEEAIKYKHPKKDIEDRATLISQLERKAATLTAQVGADLSQIELTHEQKYAKELSVLKEKRGKAAEKVRMTDVHWKERLQDEDKRHKDSKENIGKSFVKFAADAKEELEKEDLAITELNKEHQAVIARVQAANKVSKGEEIAAPGMVSLQVPEGIGLISPKQLTPEHIQQALMQAAGPNGFLHGTNPQMLAGAAELFQTLLNVSAVVPPANPKPAVPSVISLLRPAQATSSAPVTGGPEGKQPSGNPTTVTTAVFGKSKRTDESADGEEGSGEAEAKGPRQEIEDDKL